ncbi:hypothetical protein BKG95_02535 [Rodentibacter pneumotropicus]|uniref:KilA-N domain-containing protein n=2 Tax=Rodentibacter pneumotropicus TaxID=758 RepID=A0AAW5LBH2_9PAST|nr:KilA-N domain-containing protein [Rodentibacter pneumotropicus]MCQ9120994.1 KilA-N domain-containing protein [Rodentibacter pneumotropicus]OOF69161.1 hypothetical protein BKG95_02535 [Rodentibacter pneumotropicus]
MSNLTILKTSISQLDNLYNLKDLHRVSGNEAKHEPYRFVRLDTTQELISEIQKEDPTATPLKTLRGTHGGTYACEELVLAYAMWISPKFHLVVLRAFLNMHKNEQLQKTQQLALPEPPKMYQRDFTEKEIQDWCWAWYALRNYIELTDKLQKQFGGFGGDYASAIRKLNDRYGNLPDELIPTLQRITTEFHPDNLHGNGWNRIIYNVRHPNAIIRSGGLVHLF